MEAIASVLLNPHLNGCLTPWLGSYRRSGTKPCLPDKVDWQPELCRLAALYAVFPPNLSKVVASACTPTLSCRRRAMSSSGAYCAWGIFSISAAARAVKHRGHSWLLAVAYLCKCGAAARAGLPESACLTINAAGKDIFPETYLLLVSTQVPDSLQLLAGLGTESGYSPNAQLP